MKAKILACLTALTVVLGAYAQERGFRHPGGMHSEADLARVRQQIADREPQVRKAYNALYAWGNSLPDTNPNATEEIIRGDGNNTGNAGYRVQLAYRYALLWHLTGTKKFANAAIKILNGWAKTCKRVTGGVDAALAAGLQGYQFAQVGELMRTYEGWKAADFKAYQEWMLTVFYPENARFLYVRNGVNPGGYWSNWGLCNALSMMSIGILCDDVSIYNQGVAFYKYDLAHSNPHCNSNYNTAFIDYNVEPYRSRPVINEQNGSYRDNGYTEYLGNLVTKLHEDERGVDIYGDGTHWLGQLQELGRDQGHCNLSIGLSGSICACAWSQDDDLWGWMGNRLAAGIECAALVNADTEAEVPYTTYHYRSDNSSNYYRDYNLTGIGEDSRGQYQPIWYRIIEHYEGVSGLSLPYCHQMAEKNTEAADMVSSVDHLGLTHLMCIRPKAEVIPVSLDPYIALNGETLHRSSIDALPAGETVTLSVTIPADVDGGTWTWDLGADETSTASSTRSLTVAPVRSNIYRVTYAAPNGTTSVQAFTINVYGDCYADPIKKNFYISHPIKADYDGWTGEDAATVYAGSIVALSCQAGSNTGIFRYYVTDDDRHEHPQTGTFLVTSDTTLYVSYTNHGGAVSLDSIRLTTVPTGLDTDVQVNQVAEGDYYLVKKGTERYWTNPKTSGNGVSPTLATKKKTDDGTQVWTLTRDGAYYKITSKYDGRYVNEHAQFHTNAYDATWHTYNIYSDADDNIGIQVTQLAATGSQWSLGGTYFWKWNGTKVEADKTHTAYTGEDDLIFTLVPYGQEVGIEGVPDAAQSGNVNGSARPEGTLDTSRISKCYDLSGRRVADIVAGNPGQRLQKGMYIINGKKYHSMRPHARNRRLLFGRYLQA